jgi:hypothetical protein
MIITAIIASPILLLFILVNQNYNIKKIEKAINTQINNEIQEVSEHYLLRGKEVKFKIKGMRIKVFPKSKIILSGIEISNLQYQNIVFNGTIETVEIRLKILDVLKKRVNLNDVVIGIGNINFERVVLADHYFVKKKVKRIVKLEEYEVSGIKGKLQEILIGKEGLQHIEKGYKEVEAEEDARVDLDNTSLRDMLKNILFSLNTEKVKFDSKKRFKLEFADVSIVFISNNTTAKEYKNIKGKLSKHGDSVDFKYTFNLVNTVSHFDGKMKFDGDKVSIKSKLTNDADNKITFELNIKNNLSEINSFKDLFGEKYFSIKTSSLNNLILWLVPVTSEYYTKFNYKNAINFTIKIADHSDGITDINELSFKSEDIEFNGKGALGDKNKIELNIINADLNNFIVQQDTQKQEVSAADINIFKADYLEDLLDILDSDSDTPRNNLEATIKIGNFANKSVTIKDSQIDFDIDDGYYRIKMFKLNVNNLTISVFDEEQIGNFFVNKIKISGDNIKDVLRHFNLDTFTEIEKFELNSTLFIHNNIFYLKDFSINDEKQNLEGDIEFSLDKGYLASRLWVDNLKINIDNERPNAIKEKFIWLSNLSSNVFLDLEVDNVSVNGVEDIYFFGSLNYKNNLLSFYDIKELTFDGVEVASGSFEMGIKSSRSFVNASLNVKKVIAELNLLERFVNVVRYKNIVFNERAEESPDYWINYLFSLPTWNDVDGKINFLIEELELNEKPLNNLTVDALVDNGSFDIKKISFLGFGGKTELSGKVTLKDIRSMDLVLTDTTYNIKEVVQLVTNSDVDYIDGLLGISFVIRAQGFNKEVFLSSMNMESKFIGRELYVKQLGLRDLKDRLKKLSSLKEGISSYAMSINPEEIILDSSGTTFKNFSGSMAISRNVINFALEAISEEFSNKLVVKIDNSQNKNILNFSNVSSVVLKFGTTVVPLYVAINFVENLNNKASMLIDAKQMREYLDMMKKSKL